MDTDVLVGLIGAIGVVAAAWVANAPQRRRTKEVHRAVTVNHHSSEQPTILDRLDDIDRKIDRHLEWHAHKDSK